MSSTRNLRKRNSATRLAEVVGVVASVVLGGTLLVPAAHADSPEAPLTLAVGDVTHNTMTRGNGTNSFTVTVTNTSSTTQPFTGDALVWPGNSGPSPLEIDQVRTQVTPIHAPATDVSVDGQNPGMNVVFFPHGGTATSGFQIPAGAGYSWRVTISAAADFPGNDDGLDIDLKSIVSEVVAPGHVHFAVGPALPDGHLTERFNHSVTVSPGAPGKTTLSLYDGAGGTFTSPLSTMVEVESAASGLSLEYRSGSGTWKPATVVESGRSWLLAPVPAGFAYQQTHSYQLRFTAAEQPAAARDLRLSSRVVLGGEIASAQSTLHLRPASTPTATATPSSAPTSAPVPAGDVTTAGTAAGGATSGAATSGGSTSSAQLASTGSSHMGLIAGLAALLAAAGAFVTMSVTRRRRAA
ncbi:hypothetical protein [Streptomyces sp. NPDC049040]|uniref:hypothetical protein n=1 Tax=Streptomyces sp. NPDC049040 TaxID=3365593 RepID=UPI003722C9B7